MLYTPRHVSSQKKEGLNPLFRGKVTQGYFNSEEIMLLEKKDMSILPGQGISMHPWAHPEAECAWDFQNG